MRCGRAWHEKGGDDHCSCRESSQCPATLRAEIPASLGRLARLKRLNLDNNAVAAVPTAVLVQCTALHTLSLHHNPLTAEALTSTPGFEDFEERRRSKFSKVIGGGVLLGSGGFDEGFQRATPS